LEHSRSLGEVKELIEEKPGVLDREFSYEQAFQRGLYCKGEIEVNLAGEWKERFEGPLWVITNLGPAEGLRIYKARMKIDEGFNDLKSLLNLERVMNKKHEQMEKVVALVLLAYAIGLLVGGRFGIRRMEGMGAEVERPPIPVNLERQEKGEKWKLYSVRFVLLNQKILLGRAVIRQLITEVLGFFRTLGLGNVRSHV